MQALQIHHGIDGAGAVFKRRQHTIAERFDDVATVGDEGLANPLRQLGDGLRRHGIARRFKQTGTPHEIGKNYRRLNRGLRAHFALCFLTSI